jgi:hypothetical protein
LFAHVGTHAVPLQVVVPWAFVQAFVQLPQYPTVLSRVSQPLDAEPSQLPHPLLQAPITQLPVAHEPVALAGAQATPQAPQFVLVLSDASQPLVRASLSQLP